MIAMFFTQSATVERLTGVSGSKPQYGEPQTTRCRIEKTTQRVLSGQMAQLVSNTRMYAPLIDDIPQGSKVTVDGTAYKVGQCDVIQGFAPSHLELMLI